MLRNKFLGCILGLAVGDALGAPAEFLSVTDVRAKYGDDGIRDFHPWDRFPAGSYTDDTQMSLATASGLIESARQNNKTLPALYVYKAYVGWYATQNDPAQRRAPGNTCLAALADGRAGTLLSPINTSKGCGGVMRVAPVGLAYPPVDAFRFGTEAAAITHGHPSGYLPAGALAAIVAFIVEGRTVRTAIESTIPFLMGYAGSEETLDKVRAALDLAAAGTPASEACLSLGQGWVGEEALAIALYCALASGGDFEGGVIAAVNHNGDTDSTGCIVGAILGAAAGVEAIPARWRAAVENAELLTSVADTLYAVFGPRDK